MVVHAHGAHEPREERLEDASKGSRDSPLRSAARDSESPERRDPAEEKGRQDALENAVGARLHDGAALGLADNTKSELSDAVEVAPSRGAHVLPELAHEQGAHGAHQQLRLRTCVHPRIVRPLAAPFPLPSRAQRRTPPAHTGEPARLRTPGRGHCPWPSPSACPRLGHCHRYGANGIPMPTAR